jgi:hypothetical protein
LKIKEAMRIDIMNSADYKTLLVPEIMSWLLEGDPAIRWQVMRDLLDEDEVVLNQEREKIANSGWGKSFLSHQEPSGLWAGGIYGPKWISTTYTMLTLRRIGLPSYNEQAQLGCRQLIERGYYVDGGINYFPSHQQSEVCVTGMVLSVLSYFRYKDSRVNSLADHLLERQMPDGGWNCEDFKGDSHSSFHTTISALEGLLEYQKTNRKVRVDIEMARLLGHEFLLQHRLYKSDHTGEIVNKRMLRMPFPPRWFYDFLRALDYFQDYYNWRSKVTILYPDKASDEFEEIHQKDDRFSDAIELLKSKRKSDGRWNMMRGPSGKVYFDMEKAGKPGRWNTLRALRVLNWWEGVQ